MHLDTCMYGAETALPPLGYRTPLAFCDIGLVREKLPYLAVHTVSRYTLRCSARRPIRPVRAGYSKEPLFTVPPRPT